VCRARLAVPILQSGLTAASGHDFAPINPSIALGSVFLGWHDLPAIIQT
jgi:hypothetical protein